MIALLSRLGVGAHSNLLLYDAKGNCDAARFAWVLEYYGFNRYAIINGGKKAWKENKYEVTKEEYIPKPNSEFSFQPTINEDVLAQQEEVFSAIKDPNVLLIDTRETYEHLGQSFISKGQLY